MSEENPSDSGKKVDTDYPDLWTVRNYKVGVFYEKREFKGFHLRKEEKEPRPIKSLTHPLWLKDGISGQVQIEKSILEILRADGTKATRHKGKRTKWKTALENNGKKGYHVSHVRTPKGYKWVNSKIAKEQIKVTEKKEYELAVDNMMQAYLLYTEIGSPYKKDAEKNLSIMYNVLEEKGKLDIFKAAARKNNININ